MSLKKQTVAGVKWTSLATVMTTLGALLKISVLARFLEKSDFGLMAIIVFIIGFTNLFMDMGLTTAILHKQSISKNEYNSLYWINVIFSILLFFIISISSPVIAKFYSEPELSRLIPIMAFTIIISGIGRQFKTIEQKHLNFKFISIVEIVASIASLLFAVFLATHEFGVYSLVYSALLLQSIANISFFIKGVRRVGLQLRFSLYETKPFLKIGIYQVGGQIVNYFNRDIDILIIGKLMGSEVLGGYSLAKQLVRRPLQIIDPVVTKVYASILPRFQHDKSKLRFYFGEILHNVSIINALVYGLIALLAPVIIKIFYGSGFDDIYFIVIGFCVIVYLRSISGKIGILVVTTGRTELELYWNILQIIFFPIAIFIGALYSIYHIVFLIATIQMLLLIPCWYIFYKKLINLRLKVYLLNILKPLCISMLLYITYYITQNYLLTGIPSIITQFIFSLMLLLALGFYTYFYSEEITKLLKLKK